MSTEEFITVTSESGGKQGFLFAASDEPRASIILFPGAHGVLGLDGTTINKGEDNFLVRTREKYLPHGFTTALIDTPSYLETMDAPHRMSEKHGQDILAIVKWLKEKTNKPVVLVGTSMGTFSTVNGAIRLGNMISAIALTSSITQASDNQSSDNNETGTVVVSHPNGIVDMKLARITVPALVMSHQDDGCNLSPAADTDKLAQALNGTMRVETKILTGGDAKPQSGPCGPLSPHGYHGIEDEAVITIAEFMIDNLWSPF